MLLLYMLMFIAFLCGCGYWLISDGKNWDTGILLCAAGGFLISFVRDAALVAANLLEDIFHEWRRQR